MPKIDNSGYILVDFSKVDHNKHSQVIEGFYADCEKLISNEKFVLLSNVNEVSTTPIPSIVLFKNSIYNVITFEYVYTISAGDVVVVTKNEGGITVDVIDDSIIALNKTWSSSKINEMLPDNAGQIIYDNTVSHIQSNRVQSAIDELVIIINGIDSRVIVNESDISNIKNQLITIANEISLLHSASNIEVTSGVSVDDVLNSLEQNKQDNLTAGNNVSISSDNVISAVDTTYTAGNNVSISSDNVISATDTVYGAGDGIDITNNVIAVDPATANIKAANVEYLSSVSVADKLDNVPTFDTLTTGDNNKLLGVSVSGSDISVGAVDSQGAFEYQTKTLTYNGINFVFTRRGHVCSVSVNHNSQVAFSTSWTSIGSLSSNYFNTGTQLIGMVIPNGNTLMFRLSYDGDVDIICNVNTNIWAQGTAVYLV